MELKKINDYVYWLENERETDRPVLGYVLGKNFSVMIDCGNSKSHIDTFFKQLENNHLPYPKYAFITHWHWDHTFGMYAFNGDTIVSSSTNQMLKKLKEMAWDEQSVLKRLETKEEIDFAYQCMKNEYNTFHDIQVETGTIIFENSLTLDLGGVTCQIIKVGGPHEADSCVVLLKEVGVLFAGDAHSGDYYHGDGKIDAAKMTEYVSFLNNLSFTTYIPGHDAPIKKEEIVQILSRFCIDSENIQDCPDRVE
jgi:glyoxylase-like metal-dependent hydrolase (beta-lactamase superfamily II)